MTPDPTDRSLGEYRLTGMCSENDVFRTWGAEQVSIGRRVLVDELRPERLDQREAFLADVRAKAAVDHPLIASVYEAVAGEDHCFFAHELLAGDTLADRAMAAEALPPGRIAHLLRRISEAGLYHEAAGQATLTLGLEHIHLDEHGVIRLENLAVAGARAPEQSMRDIIGLGEALRPLVAPGQPGASRLQALLGWMRGEGLQAPLDWQQVSEICTQIEQQLADPQAAFPAGRSVGARAKVLAGLLALLLALGLAFILRPEKPAPPARAPLPDAMLIPAGNYPTPDGTVGKLQAFRICPHEVTIGQYASFLEILETLAKDRHERAFDHIRQPQEKRSHVPDDWAALFAAAKNNGTWNRHPVTLDSPVVGVDWWDAEAYAEWKKARLPTQEEWFAALCRDVPKPAAIPPAGWCPVTGETTDRTPQGLLAMAGSVCEWTRRPAVNPANPLGEPVCVIIGGSYLKPGSNALTREWTANRSLRRPDLGFRVVFDAE
jgi:hypothetical protein